MMSEDKLKRINYLANKSKNEELTEEELKEQQTLRKEYLQNIRQSFTNQITSLKVIDPEGKDVTPDKVKKLRKDK